MVASTVEVVVYKNAKAYQRDVRNRIKKGWIQQAAVSEERHVNWGRTLLKTVTLGILINGPSRSGGSVTVTWVHP